MRKSDYLFFLALDISVSSESKRPHKIFKTWNLLVCQEGETILDFESLKYQNKACFFST